MHDASSPPVAAIKAIREIQRDDLPQELLDRNPEVTGGLEVEREYLPTPRGDEVLAAIKAGALTQMSFGYDPVKFDFEEIKGLDGKSTSLVRNLRELRLWDTSDVNWGANDLTIARTKAAIPYKDTGTAEEGDSWGKPSLGDFTDSGWEELSDAEKRRIANHYAWAAGDPPESFGDLKLPHHTPARSGVGAANWRGVSAAMGALMGARGGVDLPEGDRDAVYNHLSKHYAQYDKPVPEKSLILLGQMSFIDLGEIKYLNDRSLEQLRAALDELQRILLAEPKAEDPEILLSLTRQIELQRRKYQILQYSSEGG